MATWPLYEVIKYLTMIFCHYREGKAWTTLQRRRTQDLGKNLQWIEKELRSVLWREGPGCCDSAVRADDVV